jgi:hypothetical protein
MIKFGIVGYLNINWKYYEKSFLFILMFGTNIWKISVSQTNYSFFDEILIALESTSHSPNEKHPILNA